jgi:signal transduction histidine kinase
MINAMAKASADTSRLQAELRRNEAELDAFKRIANTLTVHLSLGEVLELVAAEALRLISETIDVNIFLVDKDGLKFGATYDNAGKAKKAFAQPREDGLTNTVRKRAEMIVVEDIRKNPLFRNAPREWKGSIIGVPLIVRDQVIGVMNLARERPGIFAESELSLLRMLASQAAIAISNAQLHEDLSAQSQHLEHLVEERTIELNRANNDLSEKIAELHSMQEQLVEQKKMSSLATLVAGVAHEINTPLGSSITAITYLQQMLENLENSYSSDELTREGMRRFLEISHQSLDLSATNLLRAAKLVEAFKMLSSSAGGQDISVFNLKELLDSFLFTFDARLHGHSIRLETDIPEGLEIRGYRGSVIQIANILLTNSLRHAFPENRGGTIRIAARSAQGLIQFEYRDDGRGMSEEERGKVFEPFFTTRRSEGMLGLGMSELYNLVKHLLKGQIALDSEPGRGMSCSISFPMDLSDPPEE